MYGPNSSCVATKALTPSAMPFGDPREPFAFQPPPSSPLVTQTSPYQNGEDTVTYPIPFRHFNSPSSSHPYKQQSESITHSLPFHLMQDAREGRSRVRVTLQNEKLWQQFDNIGTEMIVNKSGRRMFPYIHISIDNMDPEKSYYVAMEIVPVNGWEYKLMSNKWVPFKYAMSSIATKAYTLLDFPLKGSTWMSKSHSFMTVKLTNNIFNRKGHIFVHPNCKYVPVIAVIPTGTMGHDWAHSSYFRFPKTSFIVVNSYYHNKAMASLKIAYGPANYDKYEQKLQTNRNRTKDSARTTEGFTDIVARSNFDVNPDKPATMKATASGDSGILDQWYGSYPDPNITDDDINNRRNATLQSSFSLQSIPVTVLETQTSVEAIKMKTMEQYASQKSLKEKEESRLQMPPALVDQSQASSLAPVKPNNHSKGTPLSSNPVTPEHSPYAYHNPAEEINIGSSLAPQSSFLLQPIPVRALETQETAEVIKKNMEQYASQKSQQEREESRLQMPPALVNQSQALPLAPVKPNDHSKGTPLSANPIAPKYSPYAYHNPAEEIYIGRSLAPQSSFLPQPIPVKALEAQETAEVIKKNMEQYATQKSQQEKEKESRLQMPLPNQRQALPLTPIMPNDHLKDTPLSVNLITPEYSHYVYHNPNNKGINVGWNPILETQTTAESLKRKSLEEYASQKSHQEKEESRLQMPPALVDQSQDLLLAPVNFRDRSKETTLSVNPITPEYSPYDYHNPDEEMNIGRNPATQSSFLLQPIPVRALETQETAEARNKTIEQYANQKSQQETENESRHQILLPLVAPKEASPLTSVKPDDHSKETPLLVNPITPGYSPYVYHNPDEEINTGRNPARQSSILRQSIPVKELETQETPTEAPKKVTTEHYRNEKSHQDNEVLTLQMILSLVEPGQEWSLTPVKLDDHSKTHLSANPITPEYSPNDYHNPDEEINIGRNPTTATPQSSLSINPIPIRVFETQETPTEGTTEMIMEHNLSQNSYPNKEEAWITQMLLDLVDPNQASASIPENPDDHSKKTPSLANPLAPDYSPYVYHNPDEQINNGRNPTQQSNMPLQPIPGRALETPTKAIRKKPTEHNPGYQLTDESKLQIPPSPVDSNQLLPLAPVRFEEHLKETYLSANPIPPGYSPYACRNPDELITVESNPTPQSSFSLQPIPARTLETPEAPTEAIRKKTTKHFASQKCHQENHDGSILRMLLSRKDPSRSSYSALVNLNDQSIETPLSADLIAPGYSTFAYHNPEGEINVERNPTSQSAFSMQPISTRDLESWETPLEAKRKKSTDHNANHNEKDESALQLQQLLDPESKRKKITELNASHHENESELRIPQPLLDPNQASAPVNLETYIQETPGYSPYAHYNACRPIGAS